MHRSYPTPSNPALDISADHTSPVFEETSLARMKGEDLMEVLVIAEFWAEHHGSSRYNIPFRPIHKRVLGHILARLDATRVTDDIT